MIAPFATLAFLLILWLSAVVFAEMFGRYGSRVLDAFRGTTPNDAPIMTVSARPKRMTITYRRPLRASPQLRVAA